MKTQFDSQVTRLPVHYSVTGKWFPLAERYKLLVVSEYIDLEEINRII